MYAELCFQNSNAGRRKIKSEINEKRQKLDTNENYKRKTPLGNSGLW